MNATEKSTTTARKTTTTTTTTKTTTTSRPKSAHPRPTTPKYSTMIITSLIADETTESTESYTDGTGSWLESDTLDGIVPTTGKNSLFQQNLKIFRRKYDEYKTNVNRNSGIK